MQLICCISILFPLLMSNANIPLIFISFFFGFDAKRKFEDGNIATAMWKSRNKQNWIGFTTHFCINWGDVVFRLCLAIDHPNHNRVKFGYSLDLHFQDHWNLTPESVSQSQVTRCLSDWNYSSLIVPVMQIWNEKKKKRIKFYWSKLFATIE